MDRSRYITPAEAAERLGIGSTTMARCIEHGTVRSVRRRGELLVDAEALAPFVAYYARVRERVAAGVAAGELPPPGAYALIQRVVAAVHEEARGEQRTPRHAGRAH